MSWSVLSWCVSSARYPLHALCHDAARKSSMPFEPTPFRPRRHNLDASLWTVFPLSSKLRWHAACVSRLFAYLAARPSRKYRSAIP